MPLAAQEESWLRYLQQAQPATSDRFALLEFVQNDSPEQLLEDAATLHDWLQRINRRVD